MSDILDNKDRIEVSKNGNYAEAQSDVAVWTPAAGFRIVLVGVELSSDTAGAIKIETDAGTIIPNQYIGATGGCVIKGDAQAPLYIGVANKALTVTSTIAGNHSVLLWGFEIPEE